MMTYCNVCIGNVGDLLLLPLTQDRKDPSILFRASRPHGLKEILKPFGFLIASELKITINWDCRASPQEYLPLYGGALAMTKSEILK